MDNILLTLLLAGETAIFSIIVYVIYRVFKLTATFKQFITPVDDKTPSPLAQTSQVVSDMVARSIVAQAKTTLMGMQSGADRGVTALKGEILEQALPMANPVLGGLLNSFPGIKKSLKKNPGLMDLAIQLFLNQSAGKPILSNPGTNHNSEKTQFQMKL